MPAITDICLRAFLVCGALAFLGYVAELIYTYTRAEKTDDQDGADWWKRYGEPKP